MRFLAKAEELGYDIILGELHRSGIEQRWLIRDGKEKSGTSMHQLKLAIEVEFFRNDRKVKTPIELVKLWCQLDSNARYSAGRLEHSV